VLIRRNRPYASYAPYSAEAEAEAAKHGMAERSADAEVGVEGNQDNTAQDLWYTNYKCVVLLYLTFHFLTLTLHLHLGGFVFVMQYFN
jgi:hypothetical protein